MSFEVITLKTTGRMFQNKLMLRVLNDVKMSRDIDMSSDVIIPKGTFLLSKT